jgi:hypothetical protein
VSDNFSAFGMLPFRDLFSVYGAQLILPNGAAVAVDCGRLAYLCAISP